MTKRSVNEVVRNIALAYTEDQPAYSLDSLICILNSPRLAGFDDKMKKPSLSMDDLQKILPNIWPKVITSEEWEKSAEALEKIEQSNETKSFLIKIEY